MAKQDTSTRSKAELQEMHVDELHKLAGELEIHGRSDMKKDELVAAIAKAGGGKGRGRFEREGGGDEGDGEFGAGPDGGRVRTGPQTSDSIKYSQEVTSPDDDPEREGRSLVTTHHDVIKDWAESRGGKPATVEGTGPGDSLGVLRIDFGGDNDRLRQVSWDEWFKTFDDRKLNFIYQEKRSDGNTSTFFRLESPNREDG